MLQAIVQPDLLIEMPRRTMLDYHYILTICIDPARKTFGAARYKLWFLVIFASILKEVGALGPSSVVKVTLTDWIRDQPEEATNAAEQYPLEDSEAELAAAIEASKLTARGPHWDAVITDDSAR